MGRVRKIAGGKLRMTRAEIKLNVLRTQIVSLEDYGFHVFLWRWWKRRELP